MLRKLAILLLVIIPVISGLAQSGNSPYSFLGYGDLARREFINTTGTAGAGVALPGYTYYDTLRKVGVGSINYSNPALLPFNTNTTFEFSGTGSTPIPLLSFREQASIKKCLPQK
jgi:hypothetical protein